MESEPEHEGDGPRSKWGRAALAIGYPAQILWLAIVVFIGGESTLASSIWLLAVWPFLLCVSLDISSLRNQGVDWGLGRFLWVFSLTFPLAPGLYHWRRRVHLRTA